MKKVFLIFTMLLSVTAVDAQQTAFKPGQVWNDVNGKPINAHAGCVVKDGDYYCWIGDRRSKNNCVGVGAYCSKDLLNWTDLGYAVKLQGATRDDYQDFGTGRALYRPKIAYSEQTGKWVMNVVWEDDNQGTVGLVAFAMSDKPQGPYLLEKVTNTYTSRTRDQGIFKDDDGKLYYQACINGNQDMWNCLMSDDYLNTTDQNCVILPDVKYEAPALFRVGDLYFGLFSGCTYWNPNRSRYAWGKSLMEKWNYEKQFTDKTGSGMEFCVDDKNGNTYQSQSAYVYKVDGDSEKLVYIGDRWDSNNLENSKIVWLPISMRSGAPTIKWYDEWDLGVYDEMYRFKRVKRIEDGDVVLLLEKRSNRFLSRPQNSFVIDDDNEESNLSFVISTTDNPYVVRLKDEKTGKFLTSVFKSLRLNNEDDSDAQKWELILQEDGTYKIENVKDAVCLTVSGNATYAGTNVYLSQNKNNLMQSFGIYFDSKKYPEKEEAKIFTLSYLNDVENAIQRQKDYSTSISNVNCSQDDVTIQSTKKKISVRSSRTARGSLEVFDVLGKKIFSKNIDFVAKQTIKMDCSLPMGIFFIKVKIANSCYVRKCMIL